jgi:hypothetical protein
VPSRAFAILLLGGAVLALDSGPALAGAASSTLHGQTGPGYTITLKDGAGHAVRRLRHGTYTIVVRDRAAIHDFHLTGTGVDKATGIGFQGTVRWTVKLVRGTYRFRCDPHAFVMHGSFRVT